MSWRAPVEQRGVVRHHAMGVEDVALLAFAEALADLLQLLDRSP